MKKTLSLLIAGTFSGGAVLSAANPAQAQLSLLPKIRAKVGVYQPTGDTKDFSGNTHLAGEVDLGLPFLSGTYLSAGYSKGSDAGRDLRVIPITLSKVFSPPNPAQRLTGNVYFGVGAGAYFLRASDSALGVSQSKTVPGAFGVVGYQFPNPFFVEAKYRVTGSVSGVNANGLTLMVGRNF